MAKTAIVIGAGIVGLAITRALVKKGYHVSVIEKSGRANGASIRNFGMIWPIGQPAGSLYERAIRSRFIWQELSDVCDFWLKNTGSIHLAYEDDEWEVLQELYTQFRTYREVELLASGNVEEYSRVVNPRGLKGALYSADEALVDPREAIPAIAAYLEELENVQFHWAKCASSISDQTVHVGSDEQFEADLIFICSGEDMETLYPETFRNEALTKCKLQMMRFEGKEVELGPSLCGGLSLMHYASFKTAPSLQKLRERYCREMPDYVDWGIHVMIAQNQHAELIVGDTHEYGGTHDPFNKMFLNEMVESYLRKFIAVNALRPLEYWNGTYAKLTDGRTELVCSPEPGVFIVNALGGAGMTLSFGLAEEVVSSILSPARLIDG